MAAFFRNIDACPAGLTLAIVNGWLGSKPPQFALGEYFEFVLSAWAALPDSRGFTLMGKLANNRNGAELILLTADMHAQLRAHWLRSGLSKAALFEALPYPPQALKEREFISWLGVNPPRAIREDHFGFVSRALKAMPDGDSSQRDRGRSRRGRSRDSGAKSLNPVDINGLKDTFIILTPAIQAELRYHRIRSGLSIDALYHRLPEDVKVSLRQLKHWLESDLRLRVRRQQLQSVLNEWRAVPNGRNSGIPQEFRAGAETATSPEFRI
jgi:hypothetical protein